MNTEKIEKLKKGLNNSQIPESLKEKIRQQISRLEDEDKANQPVTKAEIEKIEDKIEDAVEVAEKKEEQAEAKKPSTTRKPRTKKAVEPKAKTVRKPRTKKAVEPKTTTANKKSAMALAKEIRKPNEKWNEAVKRAGATMRGEVKEATKKVTSELEKLKAFVKRRKELKTIAGTNLLRDSKRKAKPRGSRTVTRSGETSNQYGTFDNKLGRKYSENRENRTDRLAPKYPKNAPLLAGGGGLKDVSGNYYSSTDFVTQNDLMDLAKSTFGQDWESGGDYDYDIEEIKMLTKKLGGGYRFVYVDSEEREKFENAKYKYLPLLKNKSNDGDIFVIPNKKMADGGYNEGIEEDIDMTDDYVLRVNKGVEPKDRASMREFIAKTNESREAMTYELGGAFMQTDLAGNTGGGTGGLNAKMALSGVSGTYYTGLVGETGALSSGEMFEGGGKVHDLDITQLWRGYASAILFAETDFDTDEPLEYNYTIYDFDEKSEANAKKMLSIYYIKNKQAIEKSGLDLETIGMDIWYTQGGHGAGFFDHSLTQNVEDKLTNGAKQFGSPSIESYDGKVIIRGIKVDSYARGGSTDHKYLNHSEDYEVRYAKGKNRHGYSNLKFDDGGSLNYIKNKYLKNEDENLHSENVVLLAENFGNTQDLKEAKRILALHRKEGRLSMQNGRKREVLHRNLISKARVEMQKEGIEFNKGGMFANGGAMMANQQVIDDASQHYVNYYLNDGASAGMFAGGGGVEKKGTKIVTIDGDKYVEVVEYSKNSQGINESIVSYIPYDKNYKKSFADGGAIKNQYAGRSPLDIWENLTREQKSHFLHDHQDEIAEVKNLRKLTKNQIIEGYYSDWIGLDDDFKNAFAEHTSRGEYATGGLMHNHTEMEDSYARGGGIRTVNGREYSTGRNWTNDHRQHNKGEDYEVPMSKRR